MPRHRHLPAIAATSFVLVLFYVTVKAVGDSPTLSAEDRHAASRECQDAVHEVVADARFPFDPNVSESPDGGLLLSGSVDTGDGITAARHNYECFLGASSITGAYDADSVNVWRSH